MNAVEAIRCPRGFFDDHQARDLPTPTPVKVTKRHVWLDPEDEHLPELVADARFYAAPEGWDPDVARRVGAAARALLKALDPLMHPFAASATFTGGPGRYCIHCGRTQAAHLED